MPLHDTPSWAARFWANVDKSGDCWIWTGTYFANGYGQFRVDGKPKGAHRLAWILTHGPIASSRIFVCHNCPGGDNRACVNPAHLFLGTTQDNMQDASRKGTIARGDRHGSVTHPERLKRGVEHGSVTHPDRVPRGDRHGSVTHPERLAYGLRNGAYTHPEKVNKGEQNGAAKLTWPEVRQIRQRYAAGGTTYKRLGEEYGVDHSTIFLIVKHKKWHE